ncbi:Prosaposin receptor GPR37L1 [Liparis tanakae]|uniref:Prosaposin receptor GPR37L1 n=1 Tax=Liparis tanakae TaxID=230148 RepID=A0A4Z2GVI8_9TELE|nr:Prosaposin receptor GPR37L1 [Liparis tanakae]
MSRCFPPSPFLLSPLRQVTSLGVATFSLCALSIDRFHAAAAPAGPSRAPRAEPCRSILSKLSVIWVGSLVLAAPELLLWRLLRRPGDSSAAFTADVCVREPSAALPEAVYPLVLTYHEARAWWMFGCYICLPLLFTLACDLVTRQVLAQRPGAGGGKVTGRCSTSSSSSSSSSKKTKQHTRERRLRSTVMALTGLYALCSLPESVCNIALASVSAHAAAALPPAALPALSLAGQLLLFARCSATPVLLLCLCRALGQAFVDCCCCCCEECLPDGGASSAASSASASTTATAASHASSSPTSPYPTSPRPSAPSPSETMKRLLAPEVSPAAIGTPC